MTGKIESVTKLNNDHFNFNINNYSNTQPKLKLNQYSAKTEEFDLSLTSNNNSNSNNNSSITKIPQPGDPDFVGPLPANPNTPLSGQFEPPSSDKPIVIHDGNITHTFTSKNPIEVSNGKYDDIYNDLGTVKYSQDQVQYIAVEQGPSMIFNWNFNSEVCDTLSGACENDKYRIISFKSEDDTKQRIKVYDKNTNECVAELTTDKLGHCNGMTIDGDTIYVVSGTKKNDWSTVSHFSLNDVLNGNADPKTENFEVMLDGEVKPESISGISHDAANNDTCVTAIGNDIYISKGDGTYIHTTKMKVSEENKNNGIAGTTQDLCVANDKMYVIRTKDPATRGVSTGAEGCNMIDIYDTNGKYIGSKTIDLPMDIERIGGTGKDSYAIGQTYRELESISYDPNTDSFTLYLTSPDYGDRKLFGNAGSPPHAVVTGIKFD